MSDARDAFQNLQSITGRGFDATGLHADLDVVERRIARHRTGRVVLSSLVALAAIGGVAFGAMAMPSSNDIDPAVPPSITASPTASAPDARSAACAEAQVIPGKSVGNLGGLMGWFNATPTAPCEEWEDRILDHPETVLIYTGDNTMVEAYYRTTIDALGVYAHLSEDFLVPDPNPSWPADSLVLIDARTTEVLEVTALADLTTVPSMSAFGEPYPDGVNAPELVSLLEGGAGGTYISETDTTYTFGLLRPDPTDGHTVEVPITFSQGDILVMAAFHWQCAWIAEYVRAAEADDTLGASVAATELEKFPDLEVIQKYNPELGEGFRVTLNARIVGADTGFAKRWLNSSCGGS